MDRNPLEDCLEAFLAHHSQMRLAVAHSGGGDSTALAACLVKLGTASRLTCLYVDHQDRTEFEMHQELRFVQDCWQRWGVEGHILKAPISGNSRNFEAEARRQRYRVLLEAVSKLECGLLLTAHTRDDEEETLLMRLFRGGSFWGLRGIPARRGLIVRPLLELTRQQLRDWLEKNDQAFFTDSSNTGPNLRARIRGNLVPVLEELFPSWRRALREAAQRLVPKKTGLWRRREEGWEMALEHWEALNLEERVDCLLEVYKGGVPLSRRRLRALLRTKKGFEVTGWSFQPQTDKIFWAPVSDVVNIVNYKYFLMMRAGSCYEWANRCMKIVPLEGLPRNFCLVSPQEGDRWRTPEGSPSLTTVLKRCRSPGGRWDSYHLLVADGLVYGVMASTGGGVDWSYSINGKSVWYWEENERFQQQ